MIARLIARHRAARNERIRREVIATFAAAGGKAAQRKAREPYRERARMLRAELGLASDERLA